MKKFTSVLLALLVCFMLPGCASESSTEEGTTAPVSVSTSDSVNSDVIELTFWHLMDGKGGDALQRQVDNFNNGIGLEKGIKVNPVYIDWPGTAAFSTALAAGDSDNLPDVFQLYGEMVSYVKSLDEVIWAEDYISSENSTISKQDFLPTMLDVFTVDSKLLALPYAISTLMLYYNQDYLTEAGFSNPPKTIEEMAEMIPVLVSKTNADCGLHSRIRDFELENFLAIQSPTGSYITDNRNGREGNVTKIICNDALSSFLGEWDKVVKSGAYNYLTTSTTEEFATGIDAMALMTSARIGPVEEMVNGSFEWNVAPIPLVNSDDAGGSIVYGSSVVMFDHHDDARTKATWTFMEYLVSPEAQTMLMEDMGYNPVSLKTLDYEPYQDAIIAQPQLGILFETLSHAPSTGVLTFFPNYSDIYNVFTNEMERFCNGESNVDETCDTILNECNSLLDSFYQNQEG